jgi:hypothetical protein
VTDQQPPGRIKDIRVYRDSFIGMAVLACVPFLIFGAVEVYGWWLAIVMLLVWIVILFQGTRWFMPHPRWVLGLGLVAMAMWGGIVLLNQ